MKKILLGLITLASVGSFAHIEKKADVKEKKVVIKDVIISCNDGKFKMQALDSPDSEGHHYTSYNLYYEDILQSSDLWADIIGIEENGVNPDKSDWIPASDEETYNGFYSIYTSVDEKTHVQMNENGNNGAFYIKLNGQFYNKIIFLKDCKYPLALKK